MGVLKPLINGNEIKKSYQFYCITCELNVMLYEGIKKPSKYLSVNFFCSNCNKVSYHNQCSDCGDRLYYSISIPKENKRIIYEEENSLEIKLKCPSCYSADTLLTLVGKWN